MARPYAPWVYETRPGRLPAPPQRARSLPRRVARPDGCLKKPITLSCGFRDRLGSAQAWHAKERVGGGHSRPAATQDQHVPSTAMVLAHVYVMGELRAGRSTGLEGVMEMSEWATLIGADPRNKDRLLSIGTVGFEP
jgi:hypothetical protein